MGGAVASSRSAVARGLPLFIEDVLHHDAEQRGQRKVSGRNGRSIGRTLEEHGAKHAQPCATFGACSCRVLARAGARVETIHVVGRTWAEA